MRYHSVPVCGFLRSTARRCWWYARQLNQSTSQKAKVSTGLISYHFSGKMDLMNQTLLYLLNKKLDFISGKVVQEQTSISQLKAYIEASLAYQVANYKNNIALIEIVFNAKDEEGVPYYKAVHDEEDQLNALLKDILFEGQKRKEFSDGFDPEMLCILIQGAIEESMLYQNKSFSYEKYKDELIRMIHHKKPAV